MVYVICEKRLNSRLLEGIAKIPPRSLGRLFKLFRLDSSVVWMYDAVL